MKARHALKMSSSVVLGGAALYLLMAYLLLPAFWTFGERGAGGNAMLTHTSQGIPGDPINIGIVGDQFDVLRAFHLAKWFPADPVTLRTSISIGASVLLDRPDPEAPVSSLFYNGRRQDLAFEKPVGESADQRHHLRLWLMAETAENGRPFWLGAASFDRGVEFSRDTGQITHRIAADIDAERALVVEDLKAAGILLSAYEIDGVGETQHGRNGGGDNYATDGKVLVAVIAD